MDVSGGLCYGCVRVVADGMFIWQRIGFVLCLMQYNICRTSWVSSRYSSDAALPLSRVCLRSGRPSIRFDRRIGAIG